MSELMLHGTGLLVLLFGMVGGFAALTLKKIKDSRFCPKWIAMWMLVSMLICIWDAVFVLMRPASFDMSLWYPYKDYVQVDKLYGRIDNDFVFCQSIMNLVECCLYFLSLFYLSDFRSKTGAVVALITLTMTCSKTVLYHLMEVSSGFENVGHNDMGTLFMIYLLPNGLWIWVPLYAIITLAKRLIDDDGNGKKGQ